MNFNTKQNYKFMKQQDTEVNLTFSSIYCTKAIYKFNNNSKKKIENDNKIIKKNRF